MCCVNEADDKMSARFVRAVDHVKRSNGFDGSNDDKLTMYACYKQATCGDCQIPQPSRFNMVENAKWNAWNGLRGLSKDKAMEEYVGVVSKTHKGFDAQLKSTKEKAVVVSKYVVESEENGQSGPTMFLVSLASCACMVGVGLVGFVLTVLDNQALFCLCLMVGGLLGILGSFASLLDKYGLVALYPALLRRILLERTLVEVILEGTIFQKIKNAFTEISPIFHCKTHEDRLVALENISEDTRKILTMKGVVNLFPEWQQRILLSGSEYSKQKVRLQDPRTAYRPMLNDLPQSKTTTTGKPVNEVDRLKIQGALATKFRMRNVAVQIASIINRRVNPQACKGLAIVLGMSVFLQLRMSGHSREWARKYLKALILKLSTAGAAGFAALAILHRICKIYLHNKT
mmetsp:Transcript_3153/g.4543  ORF Transcript_3153/g.4543 Transcript_3153/m.4543 type:complete len:402 (+) Transcript_3153:1724-2929(+)